jgi:uncharacterized protein with NAD-binding domain and iron-sulfur cluster
MFFATLGLEVVIVGAGLGGAALATYLRRGWLGPDTDLTMTVFDAGDEAGGRTAALTDPMNGRIFEAGATILGCLRGTAARFSTSGSR